MRHAMMLCLVTLWILVSGGHSPVLGQRAERRIALVVGVSRYQHLPALPNPANDARAMAQALTTAGFTLVGGGPQIDPDRGALAAAIATFAATLDPQTVGLFYYAGHGIQLHEQNFLAPADAQLRTVADAAQALVAVTQLFRHVQQQGGGRMHIVILDACRNNPLPRAPGGLPAGLGTMDAPPGTLMSYATQPGNVALDGDGAHSPYTAALVDAMRRPDLTVLEVFNEAGLAVQRRTGGRQIPWVSLAPLPSRVYFHRTTAAAPPPPPRASCAVAPEAIRQPIDTLFQAWTALNIAQYAAVWQDDAFQVAGTIQRDRRQLLAHRRALFQRLARVEVTRTAPVLEHLEGRLAFVRNRYTMTFTFKTGRRIVETDIDESYLLACGADGRWRIKENFDYLAR